jgi:hypothetical protein
MKAMVLNNICNLKDNKNPLQLVELPVVEPGDREILVPIKLSERLKNAVPEPAAIGSEIGSVLPGFTLLAASAHFVAAKTKIFASNFRQLGGMPMEDTQNIYPF